MEYIKIFIIVEMIFLFLQYFSSTQLETYQYYELIFGSFFIILFFGLFASVLTLDIINPENTVLNNSALIASLFCFWFYITKKLSNSINSDSNGVIYY